MKYSEAKQGRTFIIRLESGEVLHEQIEQVAREQSIRAAALILVGGVDHGSTLIVGPQHGDRLPTPVIEHVLSAEHEITGTGTVFWDQERNAPTAHIHIACGREGQTITGCIRRGVKVWLTMEVVVFELVDTTAARVKDPQSGHSLLEPIPKAPYPTP